MDTKDTIIVNTRKFLTDIVENQRNVADSLKGLDTILKDHKDLLDPQFAHYLQRRSYEKALNALRYDAVFKDAK